MITLIAFAVGVGVGVWVYQIVDTQIRWHKYLQEHDYLRQKQAEVPDDFWKGPGARAS